MSRSVSDAACYSMLTQEIEYSLPKSSCTQGNRISRFRPNPDAQLTNFTMSTSGLYIVEKKFAWNLGCYACHVLSLLRNTRRAIGP